MGAVNMQQEMQEYFAELSETEQQQVLTMVKSLVAHHVTDVERISIEQYNKEINEVLADVESGNYITQEALEKQSAQWQKK